MVDLGKEWCAGRPRSGFSLGACELLKSWVHDLEMTLSMIKGFLKRTVGETGANKLGKEFEKQE
jgi:hypothetical protein